MRANPRRVIGRLPAEPGVYRFRDGHGRTLYIGRATHLRSRVSSYWSDLRGRTNYASASRLMRRRWTTVLA